MKRITINIRQPQYDFLSIDESFTISEHIRRALDVYIADLVEKELKNINVSASSSRKESENE